MGWVPGAAVCQHIVEGSWGLWEHKEEILSQTWGAGKASYREARAQAYRSSQN